MQLVQGVPGAKAWRYKLSLNAQSPKADITILEKAAKELEDAGL